MSTFLIVVCVVTYIIPFEIPTITEREVEKIYEFIDSLPEGDIVMIAIDYDPNNLAELHPMTYALIEHCWRKKLRLILTSLSQNGPGMADQALRDISDSMMVEKTYNGTTFPPREIVNGVDYCFLGYKPYYALVILDRQRDIYVSFADRTQPSYAALFTLLLDAIDDTNLFVCEDYLTDEFGSMVFDETDGDKTSTAAIIWREKEAYYTMLKEKVSKVVIRKKKRNEDDR